MSTIEDLRQLAPDFIAPEIRAIEARLAALEKNVDRLEKKVDDNEGRAERRHSEVVTAFRQVTDYTSVLERLSRLEGRQETKQ